MTSEEIVALFKLRVSVFVVEQNCPYQEIDDYDETCIHGFKRINKTLVACYRIIQDSDCDKIGRVIVAPDFRRMKLGHELIEHAIANCRPNKDIYLEAQSHLRNFYQSHGFVVETEEFLEDGIPHIGMRRKVKMDF